MALALGKKSKEDFVNPLATTSKSFEVDDAIEDQRMAIALEKSIHDDDEIMDADVRDLDEICTPIMKLNKYAEHLVFGKMPDRQSAVDLRLKDLLLRKRCCGLWHPETTCRKCYDSLQLFILAYLYVTLPYRVALQIEPRPDSITYWANWVMDFCFAVDIYVNFHSYYYHPKTQHLVDDLPSISKRYMSSWFAVDLIAVFPFDQFFTIVAMVTESEKLAQAGAIIRLSRLIKLGKIAQVKSTFTRLNRLEHVVMRALKKLGADPTEVSTYFRMMYLVLFMLCVAHLLGCVWCHTGIAAITAGKECWMTHYYDITNTNATVVVQEEEIRRAAYVDSLYFMMVVMSSVGFGDIQPYQQYEKVRLIGLQHCILRCCCPQYSVCRTGA